MMMKSAKGSFILIGGQLISTLISAVTLIIISRFLGDTRYGEIGIAFIPINILLLFSDPGINTAVIKFLSQTRHEQREDQLKSIAYVALLIKISISACLALILYFGSSYIANNIFNQ